MLIVFAMLRQGCMPYNSKKKRKKKKDDADELDGSIDIANGTAHLGRVNLFVLGEARKDNPVLIIGKLRKKTSTTDPP
jgi:hypothetical protein